MTRRPLLRRAVPLLWLAALAPLPLAAQEYDWYARGPYRAAVPRPEALLGHALGWRHTMYHQQQQVLDRLIAAAPDRVRTEVIGSTAEGKVMRLLIISAPENLARLDQIRADLAALADPRRTTSAQAAAIAARTPAVAMLSHSIHGNEPAGFEASMMTAYQLLASDEPATLEVLRQVVTIINPAMNPDGHERLAAWNNSVAVATDEPAALEQTEPWSVWGRFNHYRFDMNRDLLAWSQLETRAVADAVIRWHPQVFVDLHSTTAQYHFPPAALPLNANLPASSVAWLERFGRGNAAAFDRFGWQYYVRDIFDLYYPGYWDSWTSLTGAIGMTFETDGGPELRIRKSDGTVTTFADGIAHHVVASLATLETLAAGREERLRDYYDFRASAQPEGRARPFRRVVLAPGRDPERALALARLLARQEIDVVRTTPPFTSAAAHDYLGGAPGGGRRTFPAGSYVVDLAQPQARLARAILEPRPVLDSAFARRQVEKFERNRRRGEAASREGYEFYDVTAWALPLSHGLDAWWTEDTPPVTGDRITPETPSPEGAVSGRARSSYVFLPGRERSARLAMALLREGFTVNVSTEPLRADGVSYPVGTYVVRVVRNPGTLHDRIAALAGRIGVTVTAVQSAFPDQGPTGVGSESVRPLRAPRILLAAGDGVAQTSFGSAWFWLERELELPVVPIELAALGRVNLADYNLLVIPDGSAGRMWQSLGAGGAERVKRWVQEGAAIIGFGDAASLLARKELELTTVGPVGQPEEGKEKDRTPAADTTLSAGNAPAPPLVSPTAPGEGRPEWVPGIIARGTLDRTHWLTFGYDRDHLPVPVSGGFLTPSKRGDNPVVLVGKDLVLSGFVWPGNTERLLSGAAWAVVENVGRGSVTLFAEDPLVRAFWRGPAGMVANAILMGPSR